MLSPMNFYLLSLLPCSSFTDCMVCSNFLSRIFWSLLWEPNFFGEVLRASPPDKGRQLYISFPQLKPLGHQSPAPSVSVLGHDVYLIPPWRGWSGVFYFLSKAAWEFPHGQFLTQMAPAVTSAVVIQIIAVLCLSPNYWMFLFYKAFQNEWANWNFKSWTSNNLESKRLKRGAVEASHHLPGRFIYPLEHIVPKHECRRVQDLINKYISKSRKEALTVRTHPELECLVTETQLGITCIKLEDENQSIAMKAVKIEGTKHLISNSKTTFFLICKWE